MSADLRYQTHPSRIVIRGYYGRVATPPFTLNVLGDRLLKSAAAKGHLRYIRRLNLKRFDPDDLSDVTYRALTVDWDPTFEDRFNRVTDWTSLVSKEEALLRNAHMEDLAKQLSELRKKENPTDDEKEQLADLKETYDKLNVENGGIGYLEELPNAFGDQVSGVHFPLSEPNIPSLRRSKWYLEEDTAFCMRLYWYKPNENQPNWCGFVRWSRYGLRFLNDRVEFVEYKPGLTDEVIRLKEDQIDLALDPGRFTAADMTEKQKRLDEIREIKAFNKTRPPDQRELTDSQKKRIRELKEEIDDIFERKRVTDAAADEKVEKLRKEIYEARQTVDLGQPSDGYFNTPLILTVMPQNRGFITFVLEGADSWSYEVQRITTTHKPGTLWKRSQVEVGTNGGAYTFQFGYPEPHHDGEITVGPFDPGYDITDADVTVTGDYEAGDTAEVRYEYRPSKDKPPNPFEHLIADKKPEFPWELSIYLKASDVPDKVSGVLRGRRIPMVYGAYLFVPGGERDGDNAVVWDSALHASASTNAPPIVEISPSWSDKALSCQVMLRAGETAFGSGISQLDSPDQQFPRYLDGRLCDVYIDDIGPGAVPYLASGIIRQPDPKSVGSSLAGQFVALGDTSLGFLVQDHYGVLGEPFPEHGRPVGDGQDLSRHVLDILRCRGERVAEVSGIPDPIGIDLRGAPLGKGFLHQPSAGSQYGGYLKDLLDLYSKTNRELELYWAAEAGSLFVPPQGYWVLGFVPTEPFQINGEVVNFQLNPSTPTRYVLLESLDIPDDDSELYNVFTLEGAADPVTKEPRRRTYKVWESIMMTHDPRYIGREQADAPVRNATLRTEGELLSALRELANRKCKSIKGVRMRTPFIKQLRPGLTVLLEGFPVELLKCGSASIAEDTMEWMGRRL